MGKSLPLGPSTVTNLDLMVTLTMKGMKSASDLQIIPALYERPKNAAAMYVLVGIRQARMSAASASASRPVFSNGTVVVKVSHPAPKRPSSTVTAQSIKVLRSLQLRQRAVYEVLVFLFLPQSHSVPASAVEPLGAIPGHPLLSMARKQSRSPPESSSRPTNIAAVFIVAS